MRDSFDLQFNSPFGTYGSPIRNPTLKTLGYYQLSLRDKGLEILRQLSEAIETLREICRNLIGEADSSAGTGEIVRHRRPRTR